MSLHWETLILHLSLISSAVVDEWNYLEMDFFGSLISCLLSGGWLDTPLDSVMDIFLLFIPSAC